MTINRIVLLCIGLFGSLVLGDELKLHPPFKRTLPSMLSFKLNGEYLSAVELKATGHASRVTESHQRDSGSWRVEGRDIVIASPVEGRWKETLHDVWMNEEGAFSHRLGALNVRFQTTAEGEQLGNTIGVVQGNADGRLYQQFLAWPERAKTTYFDEGRAKVPRTMSEIWFSPDLIDLSSDAAALARELAPLLGDITPRPWPSADLPYDLMVVVGSKKGATATAPIRVKLTFSGKRTAALDGMKVALEKRGFQVSVEPTKNPRTKPEVWFANAASRETAFMVADLLFPDARPTPERWTWGGPQDLVIVVPELNE